MPLPQSSFARSALRLSGYCGSCGLLGIVETVSSPPAGGRTTGGQLGQVCALENLPGRETQSVWERRGLESFMTPGKLVLHINVAISMSCFSGLYSLGEEIAKYQPSKTPSCKKKKKLRKVKKCKWTRWIRCQLRCWTKIWKMEGEQFYMRSFQDK